jgi:ethanolamine transporter EutH
MATALVGAGLATVALGLPAYDLAGADAGSVLGTALAIKMVAYVLIAPAVGAIGDNWLFTGTVLGFLASAALVVSTALPARAAASAPRGGGAYTKATAGASSSAPPNCGPCSP